ncbi:aldo/keto reductase [Actinotalea caeni]|uniref:aldo/keto reductase n=1 Tax=Actinotalea caeni TaxID=1348467 RepID=UPI0012E233F8|nr:aldo/keto reductase [Actinotalea caeni]
MTPPTTQDLGPQIVLGTMNFGTRTPEATSREILDAFADLGGVWLDTANCYAFWEDPSGYGGASERVLGRWLADHPDHRGQVRVATKVRWQPTVAHQWPENAEGLSAEAIRNGLDASLERLGLDAVDMLWTHGEDHDVPLEETVTALGEEVACGRVGLLGASNHRAWRVERARTLARDQGVAGYEALQLRRSYVSPRPDAPVPDEGHMFTDEDSLDMVASEGLPLWVYSPLLQGAFVRPDRLQEAYDHPGTARRTARLAEIAAETGATANQVVLSWLMSSTVPASPIVGVSSLAQLTEAMAARDLVLDADQLRRLDEVS